MSVPARSTTTGRAASPSTLVASEGEVARARAVAKLRAASEYPAKRSLVDRIAALRALAHHRAVRPLVFLSVLAGLTILGARVGPRTSAIAAPAPHPVASLEAPTVPVASLPDVATPVASASAAAAPPDAPTASPGTLPDGRVVLNLANEDDLTRLPHIGPARAKAILTLRQKLGKFHTVSELLRVKGLGRRTLAKLAPRLLVDPPPDASTKG